MRGVLLGGGEHTLDIEVTVAPAVVRSPRTDGLPHGARRPKAEHDVWGRQEERRPKAEHRTVGATQEQKEWIKVNADKAPGLPVINQKGDALPGAEERKKRARVLSAAKSPSLASSICLRSPGPRLDR
jgi:hypothetical protein